MTMAYHEVPPDVLENAPELTSWARRAIQVAAAKPNKAKNSKQFGQNLQNYAELNSVHFVNSVFPSLG
jgi:hypothetical protein